MVRFVNPFRNGIVGDAWELQPTSDVESIHQHVFDACLNAITSVREGAGRAGLVIHGAAGSGKTHLIRRLREHLTSHLATPNLAQLEQMFAYVRLDTNPLALKRHVRNRVVTDLLRPTAAEGVSQFELMVVARLMQFCQSDGDLLFWWEHFRDQRADEVESIVQDFGWQHGLSTAFTRILVHLVRRQHKQDVIGWFRGESLSPASYDRLDVAAPLEDDAELAALATINDIAKLAGKDLPLVICFDQIEALQTRVQDTDWVYGYGQLIRLLCDANPNVLPISCIQSGVFADIQKSMPEYQRDAVSSFPAQSLNPLLVDEARLILQARLRRMNVVVDWPKHEDPLWPLTNTHVLAWVGNHGITPRQLLADAAHRFDQSMKDPVESQVEEPRPEPQDPARAIENWLHQQWDRRVDRFMTSASPPQTQELIRNAMPSLLSLVATDWQVTDEKLPGFEFIFEGPQSEARVGVVNLDNSPSRLPWQLKHVLVAAEAMNGSNKAGLHKIVLFRDERLPISRNAVATDQRLKDLEKLDAVTHWLAPEVVAAIAAAHQLLAAAKSGDLSVGGQTGQYDSVHRWLVANLPTGLEEMLEVLVLPGTGRQMESSTVQRLQELLAEQWITSLPDASASLALTQESIQQVAISRPDMFGCISGDPTALFSIRRNNNGC